jgi:hypothetical protein|tara:strand:- start:81 stop:215 length:135 start_codon:yes stop_codon:yes gene_type:complete
MIRKRDSWYDVAINWVVMTLIIAPVAAVSLVGICAIIFYFLGAV